MDSILPEIGNTLFKLRLLSKFDKGDLLNEELIVLSTKKVEYGYVSKVTTVEDFYHKQFLVKYSQYLKF